MTKIVSSPNCGNSLKMEFIKQFNVAFAEGNIEFLSANVTDDIAWNIIGDKRIEGIKQFTAELEKMKSEEVAELVLEQILSHGKEGAANGTLKMQDGRQYAFSDFYGFQGAKGNKIKTMSSYCIEI